MSTFILLFSFWDFYYPDVRPSQRIFLIFLSFFFSYFPLFCFSGLLQGKFPPLFLPFCYILNFHELFFFLTLIFYCTLMHTTWKRHLRGRIGQGGSLPGTIILGDKKEMQCQGVAKCQNTYKLLELF